MTLTDRTEGGTTDQRTLDGVSVLDPSTFVTGGCCSFVLTDRGAIRVERPTVGDDSRHSGPPCTDGASPYRSSVDHDRGVFEALGYSPAGRDDLERRGAFGEPAQPETTADHGQR